ncbi:MAG: potassium transporter TrkG [Wenzhouxiangellaceae bacterium]|nr:potassium transporter TrkG [Wenzhouxiangellaceae bacterium]
MKDPLWNNGDFPSSQTNGVEGICRQTAPGFDMLVGEACWRLTSCCRGCIRMSQSNSAFSMFQAIARYTGMTALIPAGMGILSLPVALWFGEMQAVVAFVLMIVASAVVAGMLFSCGIKRVLYNHYQIFWIVSFSWLVISLLGSIPYLYLGWISDAALAQAQFGAFSNALFESVSGFTSTGLTMVGGHESGLDHSLQWWRSFSQWIGGIGIIVAVIIFIHSHRSSRMLVHVELGAVIPRQSVRRTAFIVWGIYTVYTVLIVGLLLMSDMTPWQAINYGLSSISTGGFGVTDNSMADFGATAKLIVMLSMLLGALSFAVHQLLFRGKFKSMACNEQLQWFVMLLAALLALLALSNAVTRAEISLLDLAFQAVTSLATAGLSIGDLSLWPQTLLMLMIAAMVIGGCEGSTVGGIKVSRTRQLLLQLAHLLRQLRDEPEKITDAKVIRGQMEYTNRMLQAFLLAMLWMVTLMLGVFALAFVVEAPLGQIIFEAVSALGCVGLSVGITGPEMGEVGKAILIGLMWLGRLEIIPILAIVLAPFYTQTAQRRRAGESD